MNKKNSINYNNQNFNILTSKNVSFTIFSNYLHTMFCVYKSSFISLMSLKNNF